MSQKGAIKKTIESKSTSRTVLRSKNKGGLISDVSSEVLSPAPESKDVRLLQRDVKTRDRREKMSQNLVDGSKESRISSKDTLRSSVKQNGQTTGLRSSSLRPKEQPTKKATISEGKLRRDKSEEKKGKDVAQHRKKAGLIQKEKKRGTSSIYLPKTARSIALNAGSVPSKTSSQITQEKSSSGAAREKLKVGRIESGEKTGKTVQRRSSRERRKSRTLSPSEVKILHSAVKNGMLGDGKYKRERNAEKQNDDVGKKESDDYDYEDDFEDYESDFQDCTDSEVSQVSEERESLESPEPEPIEMHREEQIKTVSSADGRRSEEEHMLDSGNYELTEARKRAARIESMSLNQPKPPPLPELRQPVTQAYRQEKTLENKSLPLSSTDEGFEDGRSGDFAKSPPISQISFIDFQKPKQEQINNKKIPSKSKRGDELLSMIKLDTVDWSLIEYTPIAYEKFIQNYGRLNTQQISVQTNEDNLAVETQTESIELSSKWTQFPISCRNNLKTTKDVKLFKMEQVGVGDDMETESQTLPHPASYDILQLNEFLSRAGKVILSLLEERKIGGNVLRQDLHELPFSEGFINLAVDSVSFLTERTVSFIHYSETLNKMLLTIHESSNEGIETSSKQDYLIDCCIGCVWSTSEPSRPIKLFYSPCSITACCFHSTNYNVVFAGLQDGSVNLWDLREDEMWHQKVTDKVNEVDWILRSPTYTTADSINDNYHNSEIVAVRVISYIDRDTSSTNNDRLAPIQICTLDEEGKLIVWSVLYTMGTRIDDLGLAQWGDIRLQESQQISLDTRKDKVKNCFTGYFDMHVDSVDTNNLFLATNSNNILHATCIGNKASPNVYRGNEMECSGGTRCLEACPFKQSYFLVGCDNGTVRLHSLKDERALLQLNDEECKSAVKSLQWSKSKPFTIFVLDAASKIHIWNLSSSDIYPMYTISTKNWGCITSMQLSPCKSDHDLVNQYLALGTDNGQVEIHKLNKDFCYSQRNDSDQELDMFLRYVDIL